MPDLNFFSSRLKELRKALDKTQYQMADLIGVARPSYNRYETGKVEPSVTFMLLLRRKVPDLNLDYFVFPKAEMFISNVPKSLSAVKEGSVEYEAANVEGIDQHINAIAKRIKEATPDLEVRFRMYEGMISLLDTTLHDIERKQRNDN